jgi:hypothetical protein
MTAIRAALLALLVLGGVIVLHAAGGWLLAHPLEGAALGGGPVIVGLGGYIGRSVYRARQTRRRPARAERNEGNDGYYWSH